MFIKDCGESLLRACWCAVVARAEECLLGLSAVIRGEPVAFFPPCPGSWALVLRAGAHQARRLSEAHAFCSEPLSGAIGTVFLWEDGKRVALLEGSHVRADATVWQPGQHGQRSLGASACARPAQGARAQGTRAKGTGAEVCSGLHLWLWVAAALSVVC